MDKIETVNWSSYFSNAEHSVLHASERYSETAFIFGEAGLASGSMRSVSTPGMTLRELSISANRPLMLIDSEEKEAAESVFMLKGSVESRFNNLKLPVKLGQHNHNIQYNINFSGSHTINLGEFHTFTITYDIPYLGALLQSAGEGALYALCSSLERNANFMAAPHSLNWHVRIAEVIQALKNCTLQGVIRYIFIESKMMELFALQMGCLHTQAEPAQKWSKADKEKLYAVKEYIHQSYLENVTLKELTMKFGLNEFKLKKGYKYFFQTTVFGHIMHLRMQNAKELLKENGMPVSDVAYITGYNNISSFSTEFKKQFGFSPRELRA